MAALQAELWETKKTAAGGKTSERSYDFQIRVKEMENKLALIKEGVGVSMFLRPGMDLIHKVKLRKNLAVISEQVLLGDILNQLFQDGVLHSEQVRKLESEPSNHTKVSMLLSQYLRIAYYSLRNALKDHYRHIVEGLDSTVVDKDDIPIPPVLPTIPAGELPIGAGRLDDEQTVESVDCLAPSNQDAQEQQQEGTAAKYKHRSKPEISETWMTKKIPERISQLKTELVELGRKRMERLNEMGIRLAL